MGVYKTDLGQEYSFKFNYGLVLQVKEVLGLDLLDPYVVQAGIGKSTLAALTDRGTGMITFLHFVVKYSNPTLTDDEIFESLEGEGAVRLMEAFYADWENFSRRRGRPDVANTIKKQKELIERAIQLAAEEVEKIDEDKIISISKKKIREELESQMTSIASSGESPEDSE